MFISNFYSTGFFDFVKLLRLIFSKIAFLTTAVQTKKIFSHDLTNFSPLLFIFSYFIFNYYSSLFNFASISFLFINTRYCYFFYLTTSFSFKNPFPKNLIICTWLNLFQMFFLLTNNFKFAFMVFLNLYFRYFLRIFLAASIFFFICSCNFLESLDYIYGFI